MTILIGWLCMLSATIGLVCGTVAKTKETNALTPQLLIEDNTCPLTTKAFTTCFNSLVAQVGGTTGSLTTSGLFNTLFAYVGANLQNMQGVINLCTFLEQFKKCAPTACWTTDNFAQIAADESDATIIPGALLGSDNFCSGSGPNLVVNNTNAVALMMFGQYSNLMACFTAMQYNTIQDLKCPNLFTALSCGAGIVEQNCDGCPIELTLDACKALVVTGDFIVPQCMTQLDGICPSSNSATSTIDPVPVILSGSQSETDINTAQNATNHGTNGTDLSNGMMTTMKTATTQGSIGIVPAPAVVFLLIAIGKLAVSVF